MPKAVTIFVLIVALGLLVLFALDLAIQVPFARVSLAMDIGMVVASLMVAYLSWTTFRSLP